MFSNFAALSQCELREKSNQSRRIYFATLRDEKNRRFVSLAGGAK